MNKLLEKIFVTPTTNTFLQLFRYGFVGGIAFIADYGTLYVLTEYVHLHHLISAALAFLIGLVVNYCLSTLWVFSQHSQKSKWVEFMVFTIIGVIGLGLNELIIYTGTDICGLHYMLSKLISTIIVFFWNFFARKYVLFDKRLPDNNKS